jgi:hypothetical protein
MPLVSLLYTLQTGCLWFSRVACLPDMFEGRIPHSDRKRWSPHFAGLFDSMRETVAVNCWHIDRSGFESAAMWAIYGGRDHGVTIESTYRRLIDSFVVDEEDQKWQNESVLAGEVQYLDPETQGLGDPTNSFPVLMWKRPAFAFEQELRVLYTPNGLIRQAFEQGALAGRDVPVELKCLVERLVLAPGTPDWQCDLLQQFVDGRLEVRFSRLDDDPITGKPREVMKPGWRRFTAPRQFAP